MRTPVLYLTHRIPYPPNKGDKLRSFNILRQLARNHRVFLGTFVDDSGDRPHIGRLREWCEGSHIVDLAPARARLASLRGFLTGEALSLPYYRDAGLRAWVRNTVLENGIRHAVAFSGPMAQYLDAPGLARCIVDFCDVDSTKWSQYAACRRWPMSWLFRREGERLLAFERQAARAAVACTFVTEAEADIFRDAAPEVADRVKAIQNGVDGDYFAPHRDLVNPYPPGEEVILFTGVMDYWPNVDAVGWFAREVFAHLRQSHPAARFYIVGMNPAPTVQALAGSGIVVTGAVPDIRPWLAYSDVVVAPLRVARGIQNKVLEAMAMARPVVVSGPSAGGLSGQAGHDFETAVGEAQFIERVRVLLDDAERRMRVGARARQCVLRHYSWGAHLAAFDALLTGHADRRSRIDIEVEGVQA